MGVRFTAAPNEGVKKVCVCQSDEIIGGGKQGTLYVLDRDAMGGYQPTGDTQIVQALPGALTGTTSTVDAGLWSTPIYWNNLVYVLGGMMS